MSASPSKPVRAFLVLCLVAFAGVVSAVFWAKTRGRDEPALTANEGLAASPEPANSLLEASQEPPVVAGTPAPSEAAPQAVESSSSSRAAIVPAPSPALPARVFFRYTGLDGNYGKLAYVDGPGGAVRIAEPLSCEVAYVGGGKGICLEAKRGVITTYAGKLFDATTFATLADFPLQGVPSRNRMSIDGALAAYTAFLSGHGYSSLDFSTQTVLIDVAAGKVVADLEADFAVLRDGAAIKEQDFNFWGVTFTPDVKGFYATLSTAGKHFLVRGDIGNRTMTVIHENVECPSLSPDGERVAYKKRFLVDNRIVWQLHVLDLATGKETALAEQRSIDDQLEWLDNDHVLYSVPEAEGSGGGGTDVWVAPANGRDPPQLYLRKAYSPSVVR